MEINSGTLNVTKIKKGELLFKEGDKSRAMYLIKAGMVRLFTKKGTVTIEIDTVRPGQILGELAFLDGNPRSLTGEALTDVQLVEISSSVFMDVLNRAPDWLKILLKTVVGRLRAANTRIRQLEAANSGLVYSEKEGGKRAAYLYLTYIEVLKVASSVLVVGLRQSKKEPAGLNLDLGWVNRYAHIVMGVPIAKITSVLDLLVQAEILATGQDKNGPQTYLKSVEYLEKSIEFMSEQCQLDASKRQEMTSRGMLIMSLMAKALARIPRDASGVTNMELASLKQAASLRPESFRSDDVGELLRLGYIKALKVKSEMEIHATVHPEQFMTDYRCMQVIHALKLLNEQKSKVAA